MDIERMKKISEAKIKAANVVNKVRNTLKEIEHGRQDVQEELSEVYKPVVKAQEDVKQTIDEKQDLMLEQLQKNQKAITSGLENILMQQLPELEALEYEPKQDIAGMQIDYEPDGIESSDAKKKQLFVDVNKDFDDSDINQ